MAPRTVKCVVIGDGAVGKTCMLVSYATNRFPTDHVPTVFDHYDVTVMAGDEPYQIGLWDTAGQAEFDRLRIMSYPGTDVVLMCFSVVNPDSFTNLNEIWVPEIRQHCPNVPFLLVGTQSDRRDDEQLMLQLAKRRKKPVSREQAEKLAKAIGAEVYVECSALTHIGLKEVFDEAIMAVLEPRQVEIPKAICCFLCGGSSKNKR